MGIKIEVEVRIGGPRPETAKTHEGSSTAGPASTSRPAGNLPSLGRISTASAGSLRHKASDLAKRMAKSIKASAVPSNASAIVDKRAQKLGNALARLGPAINAEPANIPVMSTHLGQNVKARISSAVEEAVDRLQARLSTGQVPLQQGGTGYAISRGFARYDPHGSADEAGSANPNLRFSTPVPNEPAPFYAEATPKQDGAPSPYTDAVSRGKLTEPLPSSADRHTPPLPKRRRASEIIRDHANSRSAPQPGSTRLSPGNTVQARPADAARPVASDATATRDPGARGNAAAAARPVSEATTSPAPKQTTRRRASDITRDHARSLGVSQPGSAPPPPANTALAWPAEAGAAMAPDMIAAPPEEPIAGQPAPADAQVTKTVEGAPQTADTVLPAANTPSYANGCEALGLPPDAPWHAVLGFNGAPFNAGSLAATVDLCRKGLDFGRLANLAKRTTAINEMAHAHGTQLARHFPPGHPQRAAVGAAVGRAISELRVAVSLEFRAISHTNDEMKAVLGALEADGLKSEFDTAAYKARLEVASALESAAKRSDQRATLTWMMSLRKDLFEQDANWHFTSIPEALKWDLSSKATVSKAYRKTALAFHPDKHLGDPLMADRAMALINSTYEESMARFA